MNLDIIKIDYHYKIEKLYAYLLTDKIEKNYPIIFRFAIKRWWYHSSKLSEIVENFYKKNRL